MISTILTKEQLDKENTMHKEWLVTNGIGGFACGTLCGVLLRKYHSLLVAALAAPLGRTIMLNYVDDEVLLNDQSFSLSNIQMEGVEIKECHLIEYRLENGLPYWKYGFGDTIIEKSLFLIHKQNTLCISYKVLKASSPLIMKWRPYFHFRTNEQPVNTVIPHESYTVHAKESEYEIECPNFPTLRIYSGSAPTFILESQTLPGVVYETESKRGYASKGNLSSPGFFMKQLIENDRFTLMVSTENWETIHAIHPKDAWKVERFRKRNLLKLAGNAGKDHHTAKLVLGADQFLITPIARYKDMIRMNASGEEVRSIIAGFPWFTDWGRDTMISLEGLTLCTGRNRDAYAILHTFAHYVKDGLIPNMFPDGESKGIYNTADATLWFFHAIDRYVETTGDYDIIEFLLPKLHEIIQCHLKGTHFGIHVDEDGLLVQGQEKLQLTWMDAKVGDWVVTPRDGKAVEINALWYNALKLLEAWSGKIFEVTSKCYESFNEKFWHEQGKYLYDVIEGDKGNDDALRPNQIFAISLKYPVLKKEHWKAVIDVVQKELYTPVGLKTLNSSNPEYKGFYDGDLRSRDAAYHQGTVWPWLLGPYVDAWLKVYSNDTEGARKILKAFEDHTQSNCIGTIGEIFDAAEPHNPRGCFAQAWSVAEILRIYVKLSKEP